MAAAHILVVEDDAPTRTAIQAVLQHFGYHVSSAADGVSALKQIDFHPFDVVICDMRLPDIDGLAVTTAIMRLITPPAVLLLTGHGSLETAISALRLGAIDYLLKPSTPQRLMEAVEVALHRRKAQQEERALLRGIAPDQGFSANHTSLSVATASSTVTVGALTIGETPEQTHYQHIAIPLSETEHALLYRLAQEPGQPILYSTLAQHTYHIPISPDDARQLIDPHIQHLRDKLAAELIVEIDHFGYQLQGQ